MTNTERLLESYIDGEREAWHCHIKVGDNQIDGGMFYRKTDARAFLKARLSQLLPDTSILREYLSLRSQLETDNE